MINEITITTIICHSSDFLDNFEETKAQEIVSFYKMNV